jgi:N utilization substance protein B
VLAFQCLCLLDAQGDEALELLGEFIGEQTANAGVAARAEALARKVWQARGALDELMAATVKHWSLERMQPVDRSLLRLGAYEILMDEQIPRAVAINEAIEIAREFGSEESPAFINGILDGLEPAGGRGADDAEEQATD